MKRVKSKNTWIRQSKRDNPEINMADKEVNDYVNDKDMEFHVKQHIEGKKFRFYVYEFFMLFLAVTSGFFVENIREKNTEHHREVQYIKSLISDVQLDTARLSSNISRSQDQCRGIDTLLNELEKHNSKKLINYLYYYSGKYTSSVYGFQHTDRTISQLKNAGGLRLIQEEDASNSIITYYNLVQNVEANDDLAIKIFMDLSKQERELLDFKFIRTKNLNQVLTEPHLKLLRSDSKRIGLYYNEMLYFKTVVENNMDKHIRLKLKATQLLETLNKEYQPG